MGLKQMGKSIEVVVDSIGSREDTNKQAAITKLLSKDVGITSTEMCLFEMIKDCKDDKFKALLDIVR
jgi:hypothetical protein